MLSWPTARQKNNSLSCSVVRYALYLSISASLIFKTFSKSFLFFNLSLMGFSCSFFELPKIASNNPIIRLTFKLENTIHQCRTALATNVCTDETNYHCANECTHARTNGRADNCTNFGTGPCTGQATNGRTRGLLCLVAKLPFLLVGLVDAICVPSNAHHD